MSRVSRSLVKTPERFHEPNLQGTALEELKPSSSEVLTPDIAPMISSAAIKLAGGFRANEDLRLGKPEAIDPYEAPVNELRFDALRVRSILNRAKLDTTTSLNEELNQEGTVFPSRVKAHMRQTLQREQGMIAVLREWLTLVEEVDGQVLGSQEG